MKKPDKTHAGMAGGVPAKGELLAGAPHLWDMLTADAYDDGTKRMRATLVVCWEGGMVKAKLHDRDNKRSCWMAGESLDAVFQSLEEHLADDAMSWRMDAESGGNWQGKRSVVRRYGRVQYLLT